VAVDLPADFSDTAPTRPPFCPLWLRRECLLPRRPRERLKPPQDRPEQPPRQVPFGQEQPVVPGVLDQPATRLHQPVLQARQ